MTKPATLQDYLGLITSEHADKPKFLATVSISAEFYVYLQSLADSMIPLFDIDTPVVGAQEDVIGMWVGASRQIPIPISGVYFSWDAGDALGWEFGIWQPSSAPTEVSTLPDDVYLTLIRAKIAANNWDGTTEGAYKIWQIVFPNLHILIQDNQDMSYDFAIQGSVPDSLTLALLTQGILPLKPEGVRIREYIIPVDTNPLFAWDAQSAYLDGWDIGSWGIEMEPT